MIAEYIKPTEFEKGSEVVYAPEDWSSWDVRPWLYPGNKGKVLGHTTNLVCVSFSDSSDWDFVSPDFLQHSKEDKKIRTRFSTLHKEMMAVAKSLGLSSFTPLD